MSDERPFWREISDIRTDDPLEAKLRAMLQRVETEGGCSELMTAVVIALGDARDELKLRRFTLRSVVRNESPKVTAMIDPASLAKLIANQIYGPSWRPCSRADMEKFIEAGLSAALTEQAQSDKKEKCEYGDCPDHYGDPEAWCSRCQANRSDVRQSDDSPRAVSEVGITDKVIAEQAQDSEKAEQEITELHNVCQRYEEHAMRQAQKIAMLTDWVAAAESRLAALDAERSWPT